MEYEKVVRNWEADLYMEWFRNDCDPYLYMVEKAKTLPYGHDKDCGLVNDTKRPLNADNVGDVRDITLCCD